ncbi:MAG: HTH-type transcriptional regulator GbpR [Alphaproteobacteria bacterium ADurb.BinA305]|nr:MAG: HTH-type transcriptional regulator GbpR [Alphaproteobacteria bacterium ADurb.BinA305]
MAEHLGLHLEIGRCGDKPVLLDVLPHGDQSADQPLGRRVARLGGPGPQVVAAVADLAAQGWLLPPPGNVLRDRLSVIFSEHGLVLPQQDVETASLPVITSLLAMSDMVSVLADEVVAPEVDAGILARLRVELPLRLGAAGIVSRRDRALSPSAQTLLGVLRDAARLVPADARATARSRSRLA